MSTVRSPVRKLTQCGRYFVVPDESKVMIVHYEAIKRFMDGKYGHIVSANIEGATFAVDVGCMGGAQAMHFAAGVVECVSGYTLLLDSRSSSVSAMIAEWCGIKGIHIHVPLFFTYMGGGYVSLRECSRIARKVCGGARNKHARECKNCKKVRKTSVLHKKLFFCSRQCSLNYEEKLCRLSEIQRELKMSPKDRQREALRVANQARVTIKSLLHPMSPGAMQSLSEEYERLMNSLK